MEDIKIILLYEFDLKGDVKFEIVAISVFSLHDLPPVVVPSFKLGWGSSQDRDPGGA